MFNYCLKYNSCYLEVTTKEHNRGTRYILFLCVLSWSRIKKINISENFEKLLKKKIDDKFLLENI